jgi:hypothetical protein
MREPSKVKLEDHKLPAETGAGAMMGLGRAIEPGAAPT